MSLSFFIYKFMSLMLFDQWNEKKKIIHQRRDIPYFRAGEIWWIQMGKNVVSESLGKGDDFLRPVIVFQKFFGKSALVIPLTSQKKEGEYYYNFLDTKGNSQTAILPQIRYVDGRRFKHKLSRVPQNVFHNIQIALWRLIAGD